MSAAFACSHASSTDFPRIVELPGDSNGCYWDAADHALYLVDNTSNGLLRWTDADGVVPAGMFAAPAAGGKPGLGGLARLGGTFVAASDCRRTAPTPLTA